MCNSIDLSKMNGIANERYSEYLVKFVKGIR